MTRSCLFSLHYYPDRPDSRSTDEDIIPLTPPRKEQSILKSHSTSRVPSHTYSPQRSISNDRSGNQPSLTRKRYVSGEAFPPSSSPVKHAFGSTSHPPNVLKTRPQPANTRSLSASGRADFYGRNTMGPNVGKATAVHRTTTQPRTPTGGKNTWNGYGTGPRVRPRPNLFQSDLFTNKRQNSDLGQGQDEGDYNTASDLPDLASCIRKALELRSDAEKISHIELVIKQYELQRSDSLPQSDESVSLPYLNHQGSLSAPPKSLGNNVIVSKRKETGFTKIPKPNFY